MGRSALRTVTHHAPESTTMRTRNVLLPLILAATATVALAGCSTSSSAGSSASATSTAGSSASAGSAGSAASTPKCVDGTMTVTGKAHDKVNATVACDSVIVKSTGSIVSLRDAKTVTIIGSKNTVTVDSATAITASGSNNTVFYGAVPTPKVTDSGSSNTISER